MTAKILWASETGNSEEISLIIKERADDDGVPCERFCLGEIGTAFTLKDREVLVFVLSSTGDGEMPDNGLKFYRWLRQNPDFQFSGIKFTILGMGDTNYTNYQGNPKTLERLMISRGATYFYPRGEADEQCGLEEVVEEWTGGLWEPLKKELTSLAQAPATEQVSQSVEDQKVLRGKVIGKKVFTEPKAVKQTIELRITTEGNTYLAGSNIFLYPQNSPERVANLLRKLNVDPNYPIETTDYVNKMLLHRIQLPTNLHNFFLKFVDITNPVKTRTAKALTKFLRKEEEAKDLNNQIDPEKISMPKDCSLEKIAENYSSWRIEDLNNFIENLPVLTARNYSISSSPASSPDSITIAFNVEGVCTDYLNRISSTDLSANDVRVEYTLSEQASVFSKVFEESDKLIFISTGTGVSPFRGILEHITLTQPRSVWVLHGCRNAKTETPEQNYDFLYEQEVRKFVDQLGGNLHIATSRSPPKKYIQQLIQENANELKEWGNTALLCGNFSAKDLEEQLKKINPNIQVYSEEWE